MSHHGNKPTPVQEDMNPETSPVKKARPTVGKTDQLKEKARKAESRQEALLDEGLEESFPASDPVSAKRIT